MDERKISNITQRLWFVFIKRTKQFLGKIQYKVGFRILFPGKYFFQFK